MKKVCYICKKEKDIDEFARYTNKGKTHYTYCKECYRKKDKERNKKRKEYLEKYRKENKEKTSEYNSKYAILNKDILNKKRKEYYENNKEILLKKRNEYVKNNKNIINEKRKQKRNENSLFKFKTDIRVRLNYCFNIKYKIHKSKYEKIIGTDLDTYRNYLINTYVKRYNEKWDWGKINQVEIDHIIPLDCAENITKAKELCNYKNLQLLKTKDNRKKSNKVKEE